MSEDSRKKVWLRIADLQKLADELLRSGELIKEEAALIRETRRDLGILAAQIGFEPGRGVFRPGLDPFIVIDALMSVTGILCGFGLQFESTRIIIEKAFGKRHTRPGLTIIQQRVAGEMAAKELAIKEELNGRDAGEYGLASPILPGVNKRLGEVGIDPVSRDYVYRVLIKLRSKKK